jgi:cytochrome b
MHTVRVWDLPTRLFHWTLLSAVVGLVVTGNVGGAWMNWHLRLGHVVMALLVFRLLWGLFGGHWSRFSRFVYSPLSVWRYLQGDSPREHRVGHSPLGALSVWGLLLVLGAQVASGLMSDDEIAFFGPLVRFVSADTVSLATNYHKSIGKFILIGLVVLHVAAIAYYRWARRDNLTGPMVHGDKQLDWPAPCSRDDARSWTLAAVLILLSAALATWVYRLGAPVF